MSVYSIAIRLSLQKGSLSSRSSVHFLISELVSKIRMSVSQQKINIFPLLFTYAKANAAAGDTYKRHTTK